MTGGEARPPSYRPVTAALRVLEVLEALNENRDPASIGDLHQRTGLDKATIVRMMETLVHGGYAVRDGNRRAYRATGRTLRLSQGYDRHASVGAIAEPIMRRHRDRIGWPSDVAVLDGDAMLVAETSREPGPLSFNRQAGYRAPVLGTSLGLAYLAACKEDERERIISRLRDRPGSWNRLARDADGLSSLLASVRRDGFARMDPDYSRIEYANRIGSVGVAITGGGAVHGSINAIFLKSIVREDRQLRALAADLMLVAREIADALDRQPA